MRSFGLFWPVVGSPLPHHDRGITRRGWGVVAGPVRGPGVLELDESPTDGVAREVLEETGIKVQADRLTGVYKNMRLGGPPRVSRRL